MRQDAPYHSVPCYKWKKMSVTQQQPTELPVVTPSTCHNSAWSKDWSQDSQSSHECLPNRLQNLTWSIANSAATVSAITHVSARLLAATENQVLAILQVETYLPKSQCRSLLYIGSFRGHENNPSNFVIAILDSLSQKWALKCESSRLHKSFWISLC